VPRGEDAAVDHGTTTEGSLRYRVSRALEGFALHRADQVTTICEGLRGDIVARGVSAERVAVIPNAVDAEAFRFGAQPDPALRTELGLDGKTVIGFAGSFYGYEGLNLLVSALSRLTTRIPDIRLLLVGGGVQEAALRSQAEREGVADRVVFTGRVPHAARAALLRADRRTRLSAPADPTDRTRHPAQAAGSDGAGRIFVASDVGGHRELIRDGDTGFLFRAGSLDALLARLRCARNIASCGPPCASRRAPSSNVERTWANSVARYGRSMAAHSPPRRTSRPVEGAEAIRVRHSRHLPLR
jgi:glycosyltransferase involved in cell wall biosynthesis